MAKSPPAKVQVAKLVAYTAVLVVVIAYGLVWLVAWSQFKKGLPAADSNSIQSSLQAAFDASSSGDSGGALDILMSSFKVNGQAADKGALGAFIRKVHPHVSMSHFQAVIDGNKAEVTVDLSVSAGGSPPVPFTFPQTQLLMERQMKIGTYGFPTQKWRLSRVESEITPPSNLFNLDLP